MNDKPDSFDNLMNRYKSVVYAVAYDRVRNYDDARDIAQNVFVSAFLNLHQVKDASRIPSWLLQITVNACNAFIRSAKRMEECDPMLAAPDKIGPMLTRLAIEQALSCLSDQTRLTVEMYYFGSYSVSEIACFLDTPSTAIKSRLRDARARLRREMIEMLEQEFKEHAPDEQFIANVRNLTEAAVRGNAEVAQDLLSQNSTLVNEQGHVAEEHMEFMRAHDADHGWTPLHLAAHYGNLDIVKILLDYGADIEAVSKNAIANTPISAAAWGNHLDIVEYLLERGAKVDARNAWGSTALRRAIDADRLLLAALLLKHGADPNVADNEGISPLKASIKAEKKQAVELMSQFNSK